MKILPESQEYINGLLKEYKSLSDYYREVAYHLGCRIKDIGMLEPQDSGEDEEGWELQSFFPESSEISQKVLYEDYHTSDFSIGRVIRLKVDGKTYIAEQNAAPFIVYCKATM